MFKSELVLADELVIGYMTQTAEFLNRRALVLHLSDIFVSLFVATDCQVPLSLALDSEAGGDAEESFGILGLSQLYVGVNQRFKGFLRAGLEL